MSTITISRQRGSQGDRIARLLADRLGYELHSREVINQAARQSGTPEVALAALDELGLLGVCPSLKECRAYRREVDAIIKGLADHGNTIILGRGSQVILADRPDVLHVRIVAPLPVRAARIAESLQIPLENAQAQIESIDHFRQRYLRRFYYAKVDNPDLYHMILNTQLLTVDQAVAVIAHTIENILETAGSRIERN